MAAKVGTKVENIIDFDLCFADAQPPAIIGVNEEFISGPRLDNLFSTWAALTSIVKVNPENDANINIAACFDHEECGSETITGANSQLLPSIMERLFEALNGAKLDENTINAAYQRSFFISADMAHAVHPTFAAVHQEGHRVKMNKGIVLKINVNNRYTTNGISGALVKQICAQTDIPLQSFIVKQDGPCGSTIGPMLSAKIGVKSIDVGVAQLGMHSIRETCGVLDSYYYTRFFDEFYLKEVPQVHMD